MVAFGFWSQNYGRWRGPMKGILSFSECTLSGGGTEICLSSWRGTLKHPLSPLVLLALLLSTAHALVKVSLVYPSL